LRSFFALLSSPAVLVFFDNFNVVKFFPASMFSEHMFFLLPLMLGLQASFDWFFLRVQASMS
jgi:hypothetical protein